MEMSSPLHLHKGLSWAYTGILSVVPSYAGKYRFIRVASVLIFPGGRTCVVFVCAAKTLDSQVSGGPDSPLAQRPLAVVLGAGRRQGRSRRRGYAWPGSSKRRIGWPVTSAISS